ncbi:MAG: hypothetical protein SVK08_03150 [Halobacteriota archaeon]|nr:hypothetical protein [Halobacteriota archaeon]
MIYGFVCFGIAMVSLLLFIKMFELLERTDFRYLTSVSFSLFWALFGASYLCTGIYIAFEYAGYSDLALIFFYASFSTLLMMTAPLAYFILHILLGEHKFSIATSIIFTVIGLAGIMLLLLLGVEGPYEDIWVPIFQTADLLKFLFIFGLYVPSLCMIMALLPFIALRRSPRSTKYKITLSLVSLSLVYDFVLIDVLGIGGTLRLVSTLLILLGALLGYAAFFPPDVVVRSLKLEMQEFEEYEGDDEEL